jgi:hypothetical protein
MDRGWVSAQDLHPGEQVQRLDGSVGIVISLHVVAGTAVRYNLTVQDVHTFAVGADQWVVHNCPIPQPPDDLVGKAARHAFDKHASAIFGAATQETAGPRFLAMIREVAQTGAHVPWHAFDVATDLYVRYFPREGVWFGAQFAADDGRFVTAFTLTKNDLEGFFRLLKTR